MRTFKAMFWKLNKRDNQIEKHIEIVTAEDRRAAVSLANALFDEQFEANGYLFAEFNEVLGKRHGSARLRL